ncbi:hypothetical protein [Sporocytophaga myxococcoides]|uniref:hypothetical protein n=1 Tax=Sporocytophaga myxococcoides TaxID=153721 RepID=UPI000490115A|nr:hypothetical protein [Sporocytophaga myxococcoides]
MRKISVIFLLVLVASTSFAQLSERVNDTSVYNIGARPLKGSKVLTFGFNMNQSVFDNYNDLRQGGLISGKYFIKDDVAVRGGIRITKEATTSKGDLDQTSFPTIKSASSKSSVREYVLVPGLEKHFSSKNIFDVYAGGDLYLGFKREVNKEETDFTDGDFDHYSAKTPSTLVGLGGVVGFNVFVLNLPLSVGMEYGLQGLWALGGKTHVESEQRVGGVTTSQDYYTQTTNGAGNADPYQYSKLKKRSTTWDTNSNFRLILNIYFN